MSKTFANIQAFTRTILDESSQDDWTDTEVQREVNNGYQELVTAVIETYEDFYLDLDTIDLKADQQEYGTDDGLSSNIFKVRRVEINYQADSNSNSRFYKATPFNITESRTRLADSASGVYSTSAPSYYTYGFDSNFKIGLLPIPITTETDAMKVWHIPYVADLSDSTDTFNIPYADRYAVLAGKYAAGILLRKGQQEEPAAARLLTEFEADLVKMKQQLENHVADDGKRILVTDIVETDFGFPFLDVY